MAKSLRVSALQLMAHDRGAFPARRETLLRRVDEAAKGCDLLVLPEATFPAYVLGDAEVDDAAISEALDALADVARTRGCVIVAGAAIRRNGSLFNTAIAIDKNGSVAGTADKAFLWHFDRKWFAPAEEIAPIQTSIGLLGVLVCADGRMPSIARALVDRGAEILVMPTAWVTSGRDPEHLENVQADLLARVRAFENGVPFIAANKAGVERSMVAYCGKSQIIGADGIVLALADERNECVVSADLQLKPAQPYRFAPAVLPENDSAFEPRPVRVAISIDPLPEDIDARLELLDAEVAIAPHHGKGLSFLNGIAPALELDARTAFDPGTLIGARRRGFRIAILDSQKPEPWLQSIARARALELRMYAIVFDRVEHRAYAVDPDGAIIAGTFNGYTLASFSLDARRTSETFVAPGTDIAAGLERVSSIVSEITAG